MSQHVHIAIWQENPISVVTPLLQEQTLCDLLILLYPEGRDPAAIERFVSCRGMAFIGVSFNGYDLPLEALQPYCQCITGVNVTQGGTGLKDQLISWAREVGAPSYWLDHHTDTLVFLPPSQQAPIAVADKLKIEQFLQLKGIEVTQAIRTPANYQPWSQLANRWVQNLSHYQKGFRSLNFLAKSAAFSDHTSKSLSLAQQNNAALMRLLDELQTEQLLEVKGNRVHFADAQAKKFCNGIWLEYYAFSQLKELAKTRVDIQDVAMAVEVQRGSKQSPLRNEIDVMALINNRLYIVECKTGSLDAKQSQLALYRLDSIAEVFGPLTQGSLLSFDLINGLIKQRAQEINIQILDQRNLVQLKNTINQLASSFATPELVTPEDSA